MSCWAALLACSADDEAARLRDTHEFVVLLSALSFFKGNVLYFIIYSNDTLPKIIGAQGCVTHISNSLPSTSSWSSLLFYSSEATGEQ